MDLKQLEALAAVAAHGRFSAAARALDTVQSNVSTRIARLEEELGAVLVDRGLGRLSPEGQVVLARALRIQTEVQSIRDDVASMTSRVTGGVRLGIIGTPVRWLLPAVLDELAKRHPGVEATVTDATTASLVSLLEGGSLDLAVSNMPVSHDELVSGPLWDEQMVVIAPSDHPLAADGDRDVTFAELAGHRLLLGPPDSSLRRLVDDAATRRGVTLESMAELDGIRMAATLAFQGYGPAVVPITSIPEWAERGNWNVLALEEMPPRRVGLVVRRRGLLSAAAVATRQVVRDVVRELAPDIDGVRAV
ncbi:MAG TPA: hypothetical protein DEP66_00610 [Acidimicrobiaceae bacterium]|nr:hypothetical protein [Acidimicrobiaceae bacterium]HCB36747.1 hypothetical protein [Acidimicrobiaceae bacterium]